MGRSCTLGIALTTAGMLLAALGGVWLAVQPMTLAQDPLLLVGASVLFAVVFVLMVSGGYLILSYARQSTVAEPEMELPLQLLDWMRQREEVSVDEAAEALATSGENIVAAVAELQHLSLFAGYIRPAAGRMRTLRPPMLEAMTACAVCRAPLAISSLRVTVCARCGTQYYLPKV